MFDPFSMAPSIVHRCIIVINLLMCSTWNIACGTIKSHTCVPIPPCQVSLVDHELHLMGFWL